MEFYEECVEEYGTALSDMAKIVAQMTSGGKDAIPEQADYVLANQTLLFIENRLKENNE